MIDKQLSREDLMSEIVKLRQINQALEILNDEYEKMCSQTFHDSPLALSLIKLEDSSYVNINASWIKTTGYSRQEVIGRIHGDLPLWLDLKECEEKLLEINETGNLINYEVTFQTRDGLIGFGSVSSQRITLAGQELALSILTDVTQRKIAEREIREREEHCRNNLRMLASISDAFYNVDADWRLTYINPRIEEYWQRSQEELLGRVLWDVLPEFKTAPGYEDHMRAMRERISINYENDSPHHLGWFEVSLYPSEDGGLSCYYKDISERKQAENRLRCQNMMLKGINRIFEQALFSSSKAELGRFCLEVAEEVTGSQYGFIAELNPDGRLDDIAISNNAWEVWQTAHPNKQYQLLKDLEVRGIYGRVLIEGKPLFSNEPEAHPDIIGLPAGHPPIESFLGVPLRSNGRIIGIIALANREGGYTNELLEASESLAHAIVQVLARQQDQQELQVLQISGERYRSLTEKLLKANLAQSEDRFYKVFHHNPDMIVIENMKDNTYIEANQTALDTYGYTREEIIGNTAIELGIIAPNNEIIKDILEELKKQGEVKNYELNTRAKSGQSIDVLYSSILIKFNEEECRITIMKDISDKKRYEKELARLDRLNLIGEMAASIGHEIRNPMTSVRGFLQMFNEQEEAGEKRLYYELMIEELDRANAIITEFLSMARNKTSDLQPQCLNTIINTLLPIMQAEALLKGNEIQVLLESSPLLMLDKNEIRQMILNMIHNALEAMDPGGMFTIGTEANENGTLLYIKDQGRGIDPEYLDRIGTPFVSSKDNGTGLGLAVCYSIAARHGAKIDFTTGPEGTTFNVLFPKVVEEN